jgi:hypothetical protein
VGIGWQIAQRHPGPATISTPRFRARHRGNSIPQGDTFGGAIGLQWDLRRGPLRVDTSAGFRLEKLDRREDITIAATGFQVNLGNPGH